MSASEESGVDPDWTMQPGMRAFVIVSAFFLAVTTFITTFIIMTQQSREGKRCKCCPTKVTDFFFLWRYDGDTSDVPVADINKAHRNVVILNVIDCVSTALFIIAAYVIITESGVGRVSKGVGIAVVVVFILGDFFIHWVHIEKSGKNRKRKLQELPKETAPTWPSESSPGVGLNTSVGVEEHLPPMRV